MSSTIREMNPQCFKPCLHRLLTPEECGRLALSFKSNLLDTIERAMRYPRGGSWKAQFKVYKDDDVVVATAIDDTWFPGQKFVMVYENRTGGDKNMELSKLEEGTIVDHLVELQGVDRSRGIKDRKGGKYFIHAYFV